MPTVFHMHIDPYNTHWLRREGGHTYLGVPGFRIFHGQQARPFNDDEGAWRVDSSDRTEYTAREGWDCPDAGGLWYVGLPDTPTNPLLLRIQRWGERLWTQGYVSRLGLRLIVEPPRGSIAGSDLDPENPGYVVYPPRGYTTAAGNLDPYQLNWLLDGNGYLFFTAPHPPPPKK